MSYECESPDGDPDGLHVEVKPRTRSGRPVILMMSNSGAEFVIDENHAQALVLALQAAIAEVQARAVSL